MARRKSGLTELLEFAAWLPWKVAAGLVPVSFTVLHIVATASLPMTGVGTVDDVAKAAIRTAIHLGASSFQVILPLAFLIGAVMSFAKRSESKALFSSVKSKRAIDIGSISWQDFESLVGEGFRHRGFQVSQRGGAGPDGGVDLALTRGRERFLVQCKQWRAQSVGVSVVRELYGVMAAENVAGGYVVTSGKFTRDAMEFASGRNIELMDGPALERLLRDGESAVAVPADAMPVMVGGTLEPPTCPKCRTPMVLRTAKQGSRKGASFWGCAQYPKCRYLVGIG
jgi:restriction system protein